jgi:hypothetical protein
MMFRTRLLSIFAAAVVAAGMDVYGAGPLVQGGPVIMPLGEWRFNSLWAEERP